MEKKFNYEKKIDGILKTLYKNKRYRILFYIYNYYPFVLAAIIFLATLESILYKYGLIFILINGVIIICFLSWSIYHYYNNKNYTEEICARVSADLSSFYVPSIGTGHLLLGCYTFKAYYVNNLCTYEFKFTVKDNQSILYHMLLELLDAGEFPNVKVFVKPKCYRKYRIDECNYIKELLEYNKEKVYAIIDEYQK